MGILNFFKKPAPTLLQLPQGSFTVDRHGQVVSSTLPQSFPEAYVKHITRVVLETFKEAKTAHVPLNELTVIYSALKISARELNGGAMVFLAPQGPRRQSQSS
jgi:hypothetical protein